MWLFVFIALICILKPSAYTAETTEFVPLEPPECGLSNVTLRRVVGGQPATLGAWPWMTVLGYDSGNPANPHWGCGGSLISKRHVLTAGHCIKPNLRFVRIGDLDLKDDKDVAQPFQDEIKSINLHPKFNSMTLANDIAVLTTKREVPFTSILHPICLPVGDIMKNRKLDNSSAMIAGWGRIYFQGPQSFKLLQTQVPVVPNEKCKQQYTGHPYLTVDERIVCAGSGGKSTCHGDSGGPLMISSQDNQKIYYVVGLVSDAVRCALPNYPTLLTRVTHFLDFIAGSMK